MTEPTPGYELATLLSVATRIEPELIRVMRLTLRPRLDVGAEADLWFSDLVSVRGSDAIMLDPERLPELRARLATLDEPELLPRIWQVLDRVHGETLSPALFLEERVTWLAIANRVEDAGAALLPAVRALAEEGRTGILDWFADAWPRLPVAVQETTPAWQLATVAASHLPAVAPIPHLRPDPLTPDDVSVIVTLLPDVPLALRRDGNQLLLGDPTDGVAIPIPDTEPRLVEIQSDDAAWASILVPAGQQVAVRVGRGIVRLRTARGLVFQAPAPIEPPRPRQIHERELVPSAQQIPPENDFTQRYLAHVADEFATFELFQVDPGPAASPSFADFYSAPTISRRDTDSRGELTVAGTDAPSAISAARRLLLFGRPGSGKTTFLRWITHSAAAETRDRPSEVRSDTDLWQDAVPFFLPLRNFADRDLPLPMELVAATAPPLAGEEPEGWAHRLLASGRVLLLLDGLDELTPDRRDGVARWLSQLVMAYPDTRCVVSLRPGMSTAEWGDDNNFVLFDQLPLSPSNQRALVGHWFAAVHPARDEQDEDWLDRAERSMLRDLSARPDLRRLAADPLLCSVLCAMYRISWSSSLPQNRVNLVSRALELLLGEWDTFKGLPDDGIALPLAQKRVLLQRLAARMVRNEEIQISSADAELQIARALPSLRLERAEPAGVLRYLLERTGLLRADDRGVQFAHRTFRDFLAAREFVEAADLRYLINKAEDESLTEVLFMAVAQARSGEVDDLLMRLLDRARQDGTAPGVADRLVLLAAASLDYAFNVYGELRAKVLAAMRRLIPPSTMADAELLARAGSFVTDLMPNSIGVAEHAEETKENPGRVAARVIRTLALIGGEEALGRIQEFSDTGRPVVINELLRAWRMEDHSEQYARAVLSNVDFGHRIIEVHRQDVLQRLPHLRTLANLQVVGDVPLADSAADRYPLAELPKLRRLVIHDNTVVGDLRGLTGCRALRVLRITGYSEVRDLSVLAGLSVEALALIGITRGRPLALDSLAGAPLRRLSLRHPALREGLYAIPAGLPLIELDLRYVPPGGGISLRGIGRWPTLQVLKAIEVSTEDDFRELRSLPDLRRLELTIDSNVDIARRALGDVEVVSTKEVGDG